MPTRSHDSWIESHRQALDVDAATGLSLVELVVAASELTEDETELGDLVDGLIDSGRFEVHGV